MTKKQIKSRIYHAMPDELRALDEAEQSGIASEQEVKRRFAASDACTSLTMKSARTFARR
jgi:hypothetical protein